MIKIFIINMIRCYIKIYNNKLINIIYFKVNLVMKEKY